MNCKLWKVNCKQITVHYSARIMNNELWTLIQLHSADFKRIYCMSFKFVSKMRMLEKNIHIQTLQQSMKSLINNYPRATRCGGDIVTLLWFRPCVRAWFRPSVRPCKDLVNTIETKPLHISLSNLADMLTMMRGWTLLILEIRGQRSRSQWTYMEISLWTR